MRRVLLLFLTALPPAILPAQSARGTISPGMTRARVVAALGAPSIERSVGDYAYLFYRNACGRSCGMNDLVILRRDSVVDAIFRAPTRHYTGTSSSPAPVPADQAAARAPKRGASGRTDSSTPTTRMRPSAEPNDVRPSIPEHPSTIAPAPSSPPTQRTP